MKSPAWLLLTLLTWAALFASGTAAAAQERPLPTDTLLTLHRETDAAALIRFRNARDAERTRRRLIRYLWSGSRRLPTRLPDAVTAGIHDPRFADLPDLQRLDRLEIRMDHGMTSIAYHFVPRAGTGQLVVYHFGHGGGFARGAETIAAFLAAGRSVLALSMPLEGMNSRPVVEIEGMGRLHLTTHEHLKFLASERLNPLRLFVEPVVIALNHAERTRAYREVTMVGISGGGWTTVLAAAIDPRIHSSVPVAGTLPVYLRGAADWGDFEQTEPGLLAIANYLEMYVMGAAGERRRQLHVFNRFDPCCFAGRRHEHFLPAVRSAAQRIGTGGFDVYLDETHESHVISPHAVQRILAWLERRP